MEIEPGWYTFRHRITRACGELEVDYKVRVVRNKANLKDVINKIKEGLNQQYDDITDVDITYTYKSKLTGDWS